MSPRLFHEAASDPLIGSLALPFLSNACLDFAAFLNESRHEPFTSSPIGLISFERFQKVPDTGGLMPRTYVLFLTCIGVAQLHKFDWQSFPLLLELVELVGSTDHPLARMSINQTGVMHYYIRKPASVTHSPHPEEAAAGAGF